jgi:hypothetical protein
MRPGSARWRLSDTVTVPVVGPAVPLLTIIGDTPVWCLVKVPVCDLAILSSGVFTVEVMTVGSTVLEREDPPPDTLTEAVSGDGALAATFTATAMTG